SIVKNFIESVESNEPLNKKFDLSFFTFGNTLTNSTNFNFEENHTNIYGALNDLNAVAASDMTAILLITDGNQTFGNDYKYYVSKNPVYPIMIGDTLAFSDLEISQINVNAFTHTDNNFPVEIFLNYSGETPVTSRLNVEKDGKIVYSELLNFSKNEKSAHLTFNLPAGKSGKHLYNVKAAPFKNEKNTLNNFKNFNIEVVDEQKEIALIYDVLHPDIGMLKRVIESHKSRKVSLVNINEPGDYSAKSEVFILYQPNNKFEKVWNSIDSKHQSTFIITGRYTDWNFLNNIQNDFKKVNALQTEKYYADYNINFNKFYTQDIGFKDFPPLEDALGEIKFNVAYQSLLYQNINGIQLETPLLAALSENDKRQIILFGENIWKWRAQTYAADQSFESFDQFLNSLIQFLAVSKKETSIVLDHQSLYYANDQIKIRAKAYDENLNFDKQANLKLILNDTRQELPFVLNADVFELQLNNLTSGDYNFTVRNDLNGTRSGGVFTIADYEVEHEIKATNTQDLKALALNSNGMGYYPDQKDELFKLIVENQDFASIQKQSKKIISLIEWQWLLILIIISLSLEWFIRKYRGLV
ncbi:MAG: hypothetical protein OEM04_11755, partial [Flavobacteriaceae bacterium]|nr:hypothetical protein [Flavobacteriaceae bacterium]